MNHLLELNSYKATLSQKMVGFLEELRQATAWRSHWSADVYGRLIELVPRGKLLRGAQVIHAYRLTARSTPVPVSEIPESVWLAAIALELAHNALLIHDDIIDRDLKRRGYPSMHAQYLDRFELSQPQDSLHLAESLAICVGDVALFSSFQALAKAEQVHPEKASLVALYTQEYIGVGYAEMEDTLFGAQVALPSQEAVISMQLHKTGRYSLSLPLLMGLELAGVEASLKTKMNSLSELLGLIYQIKDDELGLFGSEAETGKPVGADIREGKKTLYLLAFFERADQETAKHARHLFGNSSITPEEITWVQTQLHETGAVAHVAAQVQELSEQVTAQVAALAHPELTEFITQLMGYLLKRKQ